ncbi:uncharacterized protein [Drosophila pseudoobscura]|uniref:Uncharacterized protein isoform X1 n=1 Tax=Drosophila pseudoobscura pseudoobscura TaxID=46245 RepID=A0A6I8V3K0_DROPS|nr:uncharacterized protein LOC6897929 isoform X1 [Drosophila pseudoobscura]
MNPKLYFIALTLIAELFLMQLPLGEARSVSNAAVQQKIEESGNITNTTRNDTSIQQQNETQNSTFSVSVSNGTSVSGPSASVAPPQLSPSAVKHIRRQKREYSVDVPFDFFTNHMHCDMDQAGTNKVMKFFPFNCVWIANNRHQHEGWWRIYMQALMEAFFFGQYYERLRRFELDPHTFDYTGVGI